MNRRQVLGVIVGGVAAACLPSIAVSAQSYDDARDVYAALRGRPDLKLAIGGGDIFVVFAEGSSALDRDRVAAWIQRSAVAVSTYFGRFPVQRVGLLVIGGEGDHVGPATTYGMESSAMRLHVGADASEAKFRNDWVLVHEMVHLALPNVPRRSEWLLEGNATYVEPIARAQAGQITPQEVWRWAVEDMSKGQPGPGDEGLDHTHTWGRTYWGGAMFWLLAEIAIYEKSAGRYRLQDALRAINRASGGNTTYWEVEQVLAAGDAAVRLDVLMALYNDMKDRPVHVDLDHALQQLGISEVDGDIRFDDGAPLAALRRSITAAPPRG
ncbi:hypothetical protein ISN76_10865 [Dyella halodurans]|uniref:Peptidase M61 catalytic domain-containing protein n=1 Tax=Dyella halodurans TaxID=1920171 RepID=A0ABV9C2P8_9GAMM|nr:hypothetical protein [Dyella halodurans]